MGELDIDRLNIFIKSNDRTPSNSSYIRVSVDKFGTIDDLSEWWEPNCTEG